MVVQMAAAACGAKAMGGGGDSHLVPLVPPSAAIARISLRLFRKLQCQARKARKAPRKWWKEFPDLDLMAVESISPG